jgi:hypothetical protein
LGKPASLFFTILVFCLSANATVPFEHLLYKGQATPFYNDSTDSEQQKYISGIKGSKLAERMASLVTGSLRMKSDIGIGFESCGRVNAFFSPQRRAIVICSEFIEMILITARNDKDFMMTLPREQFGKAMDGLIAGIFFHELAHAIIHTNNVPVTGREEDVADQFAVWFAVNFVNLNQNPVIMPTIWFWSRLAKERDIPSMTQQERRNFMSNEHSLDEQRIYNMACWVLGTGSEGGAKTASFAGLPNERAQRCRGEYAQVDRGMKSHFKKYFKMSPLRGTW